MKQQMMPETMQTLLREQREEVRIDKRPRLPFWARDLPTPEEAEEEALSTADEAADVALTTAEDASLAMLLGPPTTEEMAPDTALEIALETCLW